MLSFHPAARPPASSMKSFVAASILLLCSASHAQVHRCINDAGRATFSDTPCPASSKQAAQILGRDATAQSDDPGAAQRTLQSIERARRLQQGTVDSAIQQSQGPANVALTRPSQPTPSQGSSAEGPEACETFHGGKGCIGGARDKNPMWSPQRGYYGNGGAADQKYEREQAERERVAAQLREERINRLNNCNASGCWDEKGRRYNRTGDGTAFVRADGKTCRQVGANVNCN